MKRILLLMIVALAVGALAPIARASMKLTLYDGSNLVTVTDNGSGDNSSVVGLINYTDDSTDLPGWTVSVTTGISKPVIGSPSSAELDLNSVNVSSSSPGSLLIQLTDTDFTVSPQSGPQYYLTSVIGGSTQGTVQLTQTLDTENNEFGGGTIADVMVKHPTFGPPSDPAIPLGFSSTLVSSAFSLSGLFSLTESVMITHTHAGDVTSFDAHSIVPVPAAILLGILGMGVAGLKLRKYT